MAQGKDRGLSEATWAALVAVPSAISIPVYFILGNITWLFAVIWGIATLASVLLVASGAAIVLYVIGSAAGVKLLGSDRARYFALASLAISLVVLPFLGLALVASALVVVAALVYCLFAHRSGGSRWGSSAR